MRKFAGLPPTPTLPAVASDFLGESSPGIERLAGSSPPIAGEYWIRPLPEDVPLHKNLVEGGCYW